MVKRNVAYVKKNPSFSGGVYMFSNSNNIYKVQNTGCLEFLESINVKRRYQTFEICPNTNTHLMKRSVIYTLKVSASGKGKVKCQPI